ncbi:hypothetical protein SFUMM280S_06565 [Streptomyces fumanus]
MPGVGGKTFGVSLPKIPMLATGGVVMPRSGGVPAILAEAGEAEAVLPLSKLDQLLRRAAGARPYAAGSAGPDSACTPSATAPARRHRAGTHRHETAPLPWIYPAPNSARG